MTGQTVRKLCQLARIVRFGMTTAAIGNPGMLLMAGPAIDLTMPARSLAPTGVNRIMADTAGSGVRIVGEGNLQGLMHLLMTLGARLNLLLRNMAGVTFKAVRDIAVPLVMAPLTAEFCMLTGSRRQIFGGTGMTAGTGLDQALIHRNVARSMRVAVTAQTIGNRGAMRQTVTLRALRHDGGVVVLAWIISMKNPVTGLAVKTMLAAFLPETAELARMAATTFSRQPGSRLSGVQRCVDCRQACLPGSDRIGSNDTAQQNQQQQEMSDR